MVTAPDIDSDIQSDVEGEGPAAEVWQDAADIGHPAARAAWAEAARPVLLEAARHYGSVVTYKELAQQVQQQTGIRTSQQQHHWLGDVLGRVSRECTELDEPLLSALCVNAQGSVGQGYGSTVLAITGEEVADPDDHAAIQRLECHRHFDAPDLPADGGTPTLVPRLADARERARTRSRRAAQAARPINTCPTCQMAIPATGVCDNCG